MLLDILLCTSRCPMKKNYSAQNGNSAKVEKLWSCLVFTYMRREKLIFIECLLCRRHCSPEFPHLSTTNLWCRNYSSPVRAWVGRQVGYTLTEKIETWRLRGRSGPPAPVQGMAVPLLCVCAQNRRAQWLHSLLLCW